MYTSTTLEVLIASPSDTESQRHVIRQAIYDWNISNARVFGAILLPVMWETHSLPGLEGRPQGMINDQLVNDADILIATFWTRLGTPTGEADSGTVEEISSFYDSDRPVHVYFCDQPHIPLSLDTAQVEALRNYRDKLWGMGLVSSYTTDEELRAKVKEDLTKRIHGMQIKGQIERPESTQTTRIEVEDVAAIARTTTSSQFETVRRELIGHLAGWDAAIKAFNDYSVDQRHDIMRVVANVLLEAIRLIATIDPASSLLPDLQRMVTEATDWSTFRVYIDGGLTFGKLNQACLDVLDAVRQLVANPWESET